MSWTCWTGTCRGEGEHEADGVSTHRDREQGVVLAGDPADLDEHVRRNGTGACGRRCGIGSSTGRNTRAVSRTGSARRVDRSGSNTDWKVKPLATAEARAAGRSGQARRRAFPEVVIDGDPSDQLVAGGPARAAADRPSSTFDAARSGDWSSGLSKFCESRVDRRPPRPQSVFDDPSRKQGRAGCRPTMVVGGGVDDRHRLLRRSSPAHGRV